MFLSEQINPSLQGIEEVWILGKGKDTYTGLKVTENNPDLVTSDAVNPVLDSDPAWMMLVDHALNDPSPQIRIEALQLMEGNPRIKDVVEEALKDPDHYVHVEAVGILQRMTEEDTTLPIIHQENFHAIEETEMEVAEE